MVYKVIYAELMFIGRLFEPAIIDPKCTFLKNDTLFSAELLKWHYLILESNAFLGISSDIRDKKPIFLSVRIYSLFVAARNRDLLFPFQRTASPEKLSERAFILPSAQHAEGPRAHVPDTPPSVAYRTFKKIMLLILAVVAVLALVGAGIFFYLKKQDQSRKHFY